MKDQIQSLSDKYYNEALQIRRYIHANPELSFEEYNTSNFIKKELEKLNIPYTDGYVKTGIVGKIICKNPEKRVIALRADMDALPIQEANNVEYKSKNNGVMHACGHDVHTACLLGAAKILNEIKEELQGTIILLFQPAEEKLPGGAKLMIEEGALLDPKPEIIIGQHVMPGLQSGKVGFKPGMYMASTDEIYLTIKGTGGHAAMPHQLTDSVLITSHIIIALQQVVSRNAFAATPSVLSFGKITAPGATNIIPSEVQVEGTFRTMDEEWRANAHKKIKQIAEGVAKSMGAVCEVEIRNGYPSLINHEPTTIKAQGLAADYLGQDMVENLDLRMTAEDFAYFSQEMPSTFYRLGVTDTEGKLTSPLHSPTFNIDEDSIRTGMGTMAYIAAGFLR